MITKILTLCALFLSTSCTYAEQFRDCQIICKPHFFIGFNHEGNCMCSPVELECKPKLR